MANRDAAFITKMTGIVHRIEDNSLPAVSKDIAVNKVKFQLNDSISDNMYLAMLEFLRSTNNSGIPCMADSGPAAQCGVTIERDFVELPDVEGRAAVPEAILTQTRSIRNLVEPMGQVLIDLCTVHKMGRLTSEHITSYFAMKSDVKVGAEKMRSRIIKMSQFVPNGVGLGGGNDYLTKSSWMDYRLSYSSTPSLTKKAMQITDAYMYELFTPEERAANEFSLLNPTDREANAAIKSSTIMKVYVILESENILPKSWVQGDKAMRNETTKSIKTMRELAKSFKRIVDVESSTDKIDNLKDLKDYGRVAKLIDGGLDEATASIKSIIEVPKVERTYIDMPRVWVEKNKMTAFCIGIAIWYFIMWILKFIY